MEDKARAGGIIIGIGLLLAYFLYRLKNPQPASGMTMYGANGAVIGNAPVGPTTVSNSVSNSVKARAIGPAILLADPTSSTGYSWTAPVGAHVEQASDGTYWAVMNTTPSQTKGASGITFGSQPQSIPATRPPAGTSPTPGGVMSGVNTFPPIPRGPSGSTNPTFDQSTALSQDTIDAAIAYGDGSTPAAPADTSAYYDPTTGMPYA